jgi:O-antigen ligase
MPTTEIHPALESGQFAGNRILRASIVPTLTVRYVYYAFIFSLPFEKADVEIGGFPLSRILGFILVAVAIAAALLGKHRLRLEVPPKAFWFFMVYLGVYVALGVNVIVNSGPDAGLQTPVIQGIRTLIQLLIVFWISYNLMQYERITKGALQTLALSCIIVAGLQSLGMTGDITTQGRQAAFGSNENMIAEILSLGLLIVVGLAYGRENTDLKSRFVFWLCSGVLALSIVITGSRGSIIAVMAGLLVLFLKGKTLKFKLKMGTVVILAVSLLGWLSYEIPAVRERWERTYYEGDTAGRDAIFGAAWEIFLEKPFTGWGPVNHIYEVGSRLGLGDSKDTHNIVLWILTESGLVGAVPFFWGLLLCWRAAWRSRHGIQGSLPMSLLVFILIRGMSGSAHYDKLFWVVLAYALSSASYVSVGWPKRTQADSAGSYLSREPQLRRPPQVTT